MQTSAGAKIAELPFPEAAFRFSATDLHCRFPDRETLTYLTRRVAVRPDDLLNHTRRTLLALSLGDGDGAFAALIDLFVATGAKGAGLKAHLLAQSAAVLTPLRRRYLEKHRDSGLSRTEVAAAGSVLASGSAGAAAVIRVP